MGWLILPPAAALRPDRLASVPVSGGKVKTCPAVGRDSAGPPRGSLRENQPARGVRPVGM